MNPGGDAAEQVVRLSLEGVEVAAKISGNGAKHIALLLYAALKQEQKTKGKARLTSMLKTGKELKVYTITQKDLAKFSQEAKRYGVLYCVLKDRKNTDPNAAVDVIARAEDASKIQRITERFRLATIDRADVSLSIQKEKDRVFPKDTSVKEAPEEEQNFAMVMEMLRAGDVDEEDSKALSALDTLFFDLRKTDPDHIALKYYDAYHSGSAKTLKSIQITLASRLEKFNLESVAGLTITDELDLWKIGEEKTALFAIIPDNDTSFNFLVSLLYTQLFQQLFEVADKKYGGSLPVHVQFLMDEFANVSLPDDFDKILSVMRSRGVSVSIILQNLSQLKALFEKQWESIIGNTDEFVYLGGNEQATHKYVSELLGKETIDTNTYGRSSGRNGSYSTNYQTTGRELLLPEEVRMLGNRYAIFFIRGERPIMDLKYDILKHPDVRLTTDGQADPYIHGEPLDAGPSIELVFDPDLIKEATESMKMIELPDTNYVLLSEEDVEREYARKVEA